MDLSKKTQVASKIAEVLKDGVQKNLQEFDSEISMFDVAVSMIMACSIVLRIMYEVTMVQALHAVKEACKSISVEEKA